MIHYSLVCASDHRFDAWFRSAEDFEGQHRKGLVACPSCGTSNVGKALMAPSVARAAETAPSPATQGNLREALVALRNKVTSEADYVGDKFAEEARKIHFGEKDSRGIYGEATREEVARLIEDGVEFLPLPTLPEEHN